MLLHSGRASTAHTHALSLSLSVSLSLPPSLSLSHASLMILTLRYSVLPFYSKSWFNRKRSFDFSKKILKPKKNIFFLSEKIIQKLFFQAAVEKFLNRRWRRKSPLNDATLEAEKFSTQKKIFAKFFCFVANYDIRADAEIPLYQPYYRVSRLAKIRVRLLGSEWRYCPFIAKKQHFWQILVNDMRRMRYLSTFK